MRRFHFGCGLSAAVLASFLASELHAAHVASYFTTDPYSCERREVQSEWSLEGDDTSQLTLTGYIRRAGATRFEVQSWSLEGAALAAPLDLSLHRNVPRYRISGFLSGAPEIVVLDRKGQAAQECDIALRKAATPSERYQAVFDLLDTPAPSPDQMIAAKRMRTDLPPPDMLPTLERQEDETTLAEKTKAFNARFVETMRQRARDAADQTVIAEMTGYLLHLRAAGDSGNAETGLLYEMQQAHAKALEAAGEDVSAMRRRTAAQICPLIRANNYSFDRIRQLELMSALPVAYWTEEIAQEYLTQAKSCEDGAQLEQRLAQSWPKMKQMRAGYQWLEARAAQISEMPATLAAFQNAHWLALTDEERLALRENGLSTQVIADYLAPTLAEKQATALPELERAFARRIAAAQLGLDGYSGYCDSQSTELGLPRYRDGFAKAVIERCNLAAARAYEAAALSRIEALKAGYLDAGASPETLLSTAGYSLAIPDLPRRVYGDDFVQAQSRINAAMTQAQSEITPLIADAKQQAMARIEAAFADVEPLSDGEAAAMDTCAPFLQNRAAYLDDLRDACQSRVNILRARQQQAQCDAVWDGIDAPEALEQGKLAVSTLFSGRREMPIRELPCNPAGEDDVVTITKSGALFWKSYRLTRSIRLDPTTQVSLTATFVAPQSGDLWTLADAEMSPPRSMEGLQRSEDIVTCMANLELCGLQ